MSAIANAMRPKSTMSTTFIGSLREDGPGQGMIKPCNTGVTLKFACRRVALARLAESPCRSELGCRLPKAISP
jgi:hypothetical protein